jgi:purine-binding chemotaxis protein CheW
MTLANAQQFCTFFIDKHFFAVAVQQVQEVIRYQEMTRVPLVPAVIRGLINLRGQIVVAFDLRRRLGYPDRPEDQLPMNVVVRTDDGAVSLLVDEIGDVLEVNEEHYEKPPETMQRQARELVQGVYKLRDRLMLVLDTERTVAGDDVNLSTSQEALGSKLQPATEA